MSSARGRSVVVPNIRRLAGQVNKLDFRRSIGDGLLQTGLVDFGGFVVGGFGGFAFGFADLVFLGVPADFDGLLAPVDALVSGDRCQQHGLAFGEDAYAGEK